MSVVFDNFTITPPNKLRPMNPGSNTKTIVQNQRCHNCHYYEPSSGQYGKCSGAGISIGLRSTYNMEPVPAMVPKYGMCNSYVQGNDRGKPMSNHVPTASKFSDRELVEDLIQKKFPKVLPIYDLPKAYCPNPAGVKAIYLGCDPSNGKIEPQRFEYAFALEALSGKNVGLFQQFVDFHTSNLDQVGLYWDDVYVQNLCPNYFEKQTSKNLYAWNRAATGYWIAVFAKEIEWIPLNVPILLTSSYLYRVLVKGVRAKLKTPAFYQEGHEIPIPPEANWLNRPLIPFYRGKNPNLPIDYHLSHTEWTAYRIRVFNLIHNGQPEQG